MQIKNILCITHQLTLRLLSLFELRNQDDLLMEVGTGAAFSVNVRGLLPLHPSQASPGTTTEDVHRRTYLPESQIRAHNGQSQTLNLLVVKEKGPSLIGRDWLHHTAISLTVDS